ncbi:MAG: Bax inhibitor-1/YccA family protein [Proteobacteria bacterium]|nr:Bax inhibitor-1/YccA family protein [Pseudomonadota bacterium]
MNSDARSSSWQRPAPAAPVDVVAPDSHRVLRNVYWLLALSLLPTIAGALVGTQLNFFGLFRAYPVATPLLMFGAMMAVMFVVQRLRNSGWGVVALLGFTFLAGVFLTPILTVAAGFRNGGQLIGLAGGMTAGVFFVMAAVATVTKKDFSFLGNFLFIGLILLVIASLANLFFQVPMASVAISAVAVLLFSAYLLYDLSNIIHGGETNYISATLNLYLNLYNIFVSLLNLLMAFSGQRD